MVKVSISNCSTYAFIKTEAQELFYNQVKIRAKNKPYKEITFVIPYFNFHSKNLLCTVNLKENLFVF